MENSKKILPVKENTVNLEILVNPGNFVLNTPILKIKDSAIFGAKFSNLFPRIHAYE